MKFEDLSQVINMSNDATIDIYGTDAIEPINPTVNQTDLFSYDIDSYDPTKPQSFNQLPNQANPYADPRLAAYQQPSPYQHQATYQPAPSPYAQTAVPSPYQTQPPVAAPYQQPQQPVYNAEYNYADPNQQMQPNNQSAAPYPPQAGHPQMQMYQQPQPPMNQPTMQQPVIPSNYDGPSAPRVPPFKLFVGQLTEQTDIPALNAMFQHFGPIDEAVILLEKGTGRSKCCGFVTFADQASGERAIAEMHDKITVEGARRPMIVRWSTDSKSAQPQPPPQTRKRVKPERFDQVPSYDGMPNPANPRCKLFVSNLLPTQGEDDLQEMFGPFGAINEIHIVREKGSGRSKCVAFVRYNFESEAQSAISALNGRSGMRVEIADERRPGAGRGDRGGHDRGTPPMNPSNPFGMAHLNQPNQFSTLNLPPSQYPPPFDPLAPPQAAYPPVYGAPPPMQPPMNSPYPPYYQPPSSNDGQYPPDQNAYPPQQPTYPPANQAGPSNGDSNAYNGYPPAYPPHSDQMQNPSFNPPSAHDPRPFSPREKSQESYKPDRSPRSRPQNDRDSRDPVNWNSLPDGANLLVENLPESFNESDLSSMFGRLGQIISCKIPRDSSRRSRGIGYVTFSTGESGRQAVKEFDGTTHNGKRIMVKIKAPPGGGRRGGDDRDYRGGRDRDRDRNDRGGDRDRGRDSYRHRPY